MLLKFVICSIGDMNKWDWNILFNGVGYFVYGIGIDN